MRKWRSSLVALLVALMLALWFAALVLPALRHNGLADLTQSRARSLRLVAWQRCGLRAPFHEVWLDPNRDGGIVNCRAPFRMRGMWFYWRFSTTFNRGIILSEEGDDRFMRLAWFLFLGGEALLALLVYLVLRPSVKPS